MKRIEQNIIKIFNLKSKRFPFQSQNRDYFLDLNYFDAYEMDVPGSVFISFHLFHSQIKIYIDIIIVTNRETVTCSIHLYTKNKRTYLRMGTGIEEQTCPIGS